MSSKWRNKDLVRFRVSLHLVSEFLKELAMNVSIHLSEGHCSGLVEWFVRWSEVFDLVLFLLEHRNRWIANLLLSENLSFNERGQTLFVVAKTNFVGWFLPDILIFIKLGYFAFFERVDVEMLVFHDDLLIEFVQFSLFLHLLLFDHVVTGDENGVEVLFVGESWALDSYLVFEVGFAFSFWVVLEALHLMFGLLSLQMIRNLEVLKH